MAIKKQNLAELEAVLNSGYVKLMLYGYLCLVYFQY